MQWRKIEMAMAHHFEDNWEQLQMFTVPVIRIILNVFVRTGRCHIETMLWVLENCPGIGQNTSPKTVSI